LTRFDPRLTPARPDLAARHLEGKIAATAYVDGHWSGVLEASVPVRRTPSPDATLETEALMGERVCVYETTDEGWCWGQLEADGYVGYLPANALTAAATTPTHKVAAIRTLMFAGPSIHLTPLAAPPLGAKLSIVSEDERFAATTMGAYVPVKHLAPLDRFESDFVAVAERFLGVPYLWGGKTSLGIDCSGLVQVALATCGIPAPRDSDLQEQALGALQRGDDYQRGDLMFWRRHVAIVRDRHTLVHANAYTMAVTIEPIAEVLARIRDSHGEPTSIKRLAGDRLPADGPPA
jgi:cell wall-associated NlpC family hydrolase